MSDHVFSGAVVVTLANDAESIVAAAVDNINGGINVVVVAAAAAAAAVVVATR